jgi:hypothetical protein
VEDAFALAEVLGGLGEKSLLLAHEAKVVEDARLAGAVAQVCTTTALWLASLQWRGPQAATTLVWLCMLPASLGVASVISRWNMALRSAINRTHRARRADLQRTAMSADHNGLAIGKTNGRSAGRNDLINMPDPPQ